MPNGCCNGTVLLSCSALCEVRRFPPFTTDRQLPDFAQRVVGARWCCSDYPACVGCCQQGRATFTQWYRVLRGEGGGVGAALIDPGYSVEGCRTESKLITGIHYNAPRHFCYTAR